MNENKKNIRTVLYLATIIGSIAAIISFAAGRDLYGTQCSVQATIAITGAFMLDAFIKDSEREQKK